MLVWYWNTKYFSFDLHLKHEQLKKKITFSERASTED